LLPENPGELRSNFRAHEAPVAPKNPDNAMDDSREAVLHWICGLFVFEKSPRWDAIARSLAAGIFSFRRYWKTRDGNTATELKSSCNLDFPLGKIRYWAVTPEAL
jgi:hypothetical protein